MLKIYCTALFAVLSATAFAQTNPDVPRDTLEGENIEIRSGLQKPGETVAKVPLKNLENSQVYNVVSSETMQAQQTYTLQTAMRNAPGMSIVFPATGRVGDGGTYYTSRGFTTNASLINGVAGAVYSNPDAINIERVEVLKGPSATLYGSSLSSYGGAINVITKKPFDSTAGTVSYSTGSWNLNRLTLDYNTPLDVNKKVLFRVNGAYHYQHSYQDYGFTKRITVAPSLLYKASDRLSLSVDVGFSNIQATAVPWLYADSSHTGVINAKDLKIDYNKYYFPGDIYPTTKTFNLMSQVNYVLSSKWKSQTIFSSSMNNSQGAGVYMSFLTDTSLSRQNQTYEGTTSQINIQQNFIGDLKIAGMRHRMLVGADYYRNYTNSTYKLFMGLSDVVYTNQPNPNYMDYNKSKYDNASFVYYPAYSGITVYNRFGAYFADVVNITDKLLVNVGLRYDYYKNQGLQDAFADTTTGQYDQHQLSPRAGLVYQVVKDKVSVFANYQNGFNNVTGRDFYGNIFRPEHANQFEGGVKTSLLKNRLTGSVSVYSITVTNTVRADVDHPTFSIQNGTQRSQGIEVDLNYCANKNLNIVLGYGYNDNVYTKADEDVQGRRPIQAGAAHLGNFWANYRLSSGTLKGLGIGAGGNFSGKKYVNNDTGYGVFYAPAYVVFNAAVFYDRPTYRLSMNVNNVGNQKYWIGWNQLVPQSLREFVITASYKF